MHIYIRTFTSTFGVTSCLVAALAAAASVPPALSGISSISGISGISDTAAGAPFPIPILPLPILGDYKNLYDRCISAGPDTYVGVRYQDGFYTEFQYNQCYPYSLPDHGLAQVAVFCRAATCYNNPNPDCTGGAVPPVPVPLPALAFLPNVADFVQILGQGATCQRNGLII